MAGFDLTTSAEGGDDTTGPRRQGPTNGARNFLSQSVNRQMIGPSFAVCVTVA
jgi:hypothetical protein